MRRAQAASAILALLFCAFRAAAQAPVLGFGGTAAVGRWNPLSIDASYTARASDLELSFLDEEGRLRGRESFRVGGSRGVQLPVLVWPGLKTIGISLRSGGRESSSFSVNAVAKPFNGHIILSLGQDAPSQRALSSILMPRESVQVVPVEASDLPSEPLAWDCVSALVADRASLVLNPAQEEALRSWQAGGGILSISGEDGPLSLQPYAESGRLSFSTAFGAALDVQGKGIGFLPFGFFLVFLAWAAATAFILLSPPLARWRLPLLCAWIVISSLSAPALSGRLSSRDAKGAGLISRAIILPGGEGIMTEFRLSLSPSEEEDFSLFNASHLSISASFDKREGGTISNDRPASWTHDSRKSWLSLARGDASCAILHGLLPAVAAQGSDAQAIPAALSFAGGRPDMGGLQPRGNLCLRRPDGVWWTWLPEGRIWGQSRSIPEFARAEAAWIDSLLPHLGKKTLVLGDGRLAALPLRLEGRPAERLSRSRLLWMAPLPEGAEELP